MADMEKVATYIVVIIIVALAAAWMIKRRLSYKKPRAEEITEEMIKRAERARRREWRDVAAFQKWKALMEAALRQDDVDDAVAEVIKQAREAEEDNLARDALVVASGLTDEESKARTDAVFAGYTKAQQDMDCEVSAPVGLCMRPYKSVEENYQIGYRFVQECGVPGERVHINMSRGIGPKISDILAESAAKNNKAD